MPQSLEIPGLVRLLDAGITPWHAVSHVRQLLLDANFSELSEDKVWILEPARAYFCVRGHGSLFAFRTPLSFNHLSKITLLGAHTDSPSLRLKPNPSIYREGYHMLNVEVYGSPILSTWLDRDLGIAGQVVYRRKNAKGLLTRLVETDLTVRIPSLAIHLETDTINSSKLNSQTHLMPILGLQGSDLYIQHIMESYLEPGEELVEWDLLLHDRARAIMCGFQGEFLSSARVDNLAMTHATTRALIDTSPHGENLHAVALFHNEEVGSQSYLGADSEFATTCLERIFTSFRLGRDHLFAATAGSLLISADMAHAVHPAHEERHDPTHKPRINAGPVIKYNGNRRYATDAQGAARIREAARLSGVPLQAFSPRNDQRCGTTIGPVLSSRLGMVAVDIGNPMLSMHSIRELCGTEDQDSMVRLLKTILQMEA